MIKLVGLLAICSFMFAGCSSKNESPIISMEVKKDAQYIEDIVYCLNDGKKDILFKHTYFLENDSIAYYQKGYLDVGMKISRNTTSGEPLSKSFQWTIIENTEVSDKSINRVIENSISNYAIENTNSGRMSIGFTMLRKGDDWLVLHADKTLRSSHRLPESILEKASSKGITQVVHTRVISDSKEVVSVSKVYSSK